MTDLFRFELITGEVVTVDADDRELVESNGPWYAKRLVHTTYVQSSNPGRGNGSTLLHRLLLDPADGAQVDHINRDGLDNRRANLRTCTPSENKANSPSSGGVSAYKGVSRSRGKWFVMCCVDGERYFLGRFTNEADAARAYDVAAAEQWGEFAWLNRDHFPELADGGHDDA